MLIGGDRGAAEGLDSTDPGDPSRLVARAGRAGADEAAAAVEAAVRGVRDWAARPGRGARAGALARPHRACASAAPS